MKLDRFFDGQVKPPHQFRAQSASVGNGATSRSSRPSDADLVSLNSRSDKGCRKSVTAGARQPNTGGLAAAVNAAAHENNVNRLAFHSFWMVRQMPEDRIHGAQRGRRQ